MKQLLLFFLIPISFQTNEAQQKDPKTLLSQMFGAFTWEMIKPSSQTIIRKGERTSEPYFEGQLFLFRETFFDSKIEQVGFFGYDTKEKQVLSVGFYNVDMGPHILKGSPVKLDKGYLVTFFEKDKKIVLHIENRNHHFWKYYTRRGDVWIVDDLRIDFQRKK